MKPRERAGAVWDMFTLDLMMPNGDRPPVTVDRVILAIEQAIIAAEDAAFKAGAEKEREACAQIAESAVGEVPAHNSQTVAYIPDIIAANDRALYIADEIRARKENKTND
jgi:hypothetical protein